MNLEPLNILWAGILCNIWSQSLIQSCFLMGFDFIGKWGLLISFLLIYLLSWESLWHVLDMSWCWPDVVKFCWHLSFVATSTFWRIVYVGHNRQWPGEKGTFHFYFIFRFFGMRWVHFMKNEKTCSEVHFFALKFGTFWGFFDMSWHVERWCQYH